MRRNAGGGPVQTSHACFPCVTTRSSQSSSKHALHLSVPSPRCSPGYRIRASLSAVSHGHSPLLLTTSHRDAAGLSLCWPCVAAPSQDRSTSQTSLVSSQVPEGLPPTQGINTVPIILHLQSSSGNIETTLRKPCVPHAYFRYYKK